MLDRFGFLHWTTTYVAEGFGVPPLVPADATYCELDTLDCRPVDLRQLTVASREPLRVVGEGVRGMCPECYPASKPEPRP